MMMHIEKKKQKREDRRYFSGIELIEDNSNMNSEVRGWGQGKATYIPL